MSKPTQQLDQVVIRFAGDSGDGMQLTGDRFTSDAAVFGNDRATLPNYPAEMRAPLAATVLGGVIYSTALTLVLIPVVYTLIESAMDFVHRVLRLTHLERPHEAVPIAGGADTE